MKPSKSGLSFSDNAALIISFFGVLFTLLPLLLGDKIESILFGADIRVVKSEVSLEKLDSSKNKVQIYDIFNSGYTSSKDIKIVATLDKNTYRYEVVSDESIIKSINNFKKIEISLERLSPKSHVKITVLSAENIKLLNLYYIDDGGKNVIATGSYQDASFNWSVALSLFFMLIFLMILIRFYLRGSEDRLLVRFNELSSQMHDDSRLIRSDIADFKPEGIKVEGQNNAPEEKNAESDETLIERLLKFPARINK